MLSASKTPATNTKEQVQEMFSFQRFANPSQIISQTLELHFNNSKQLY
jgi:hypothetical protein